MSVAVDTAKSISWFAFFKFASQTFSWAVTIILARMLVPEDYALMDMATILTGYAALFSELGLGAAIVQKEKTSHRELSSVFWFGFICSALFGLGCILLAYPTAMIFKQDRLIPITQVVSVIFFLNGLVIVPANILRKNMQFKELGVIEIGGVIISSGCMLAIAYAGGGVWTFIGGHIIRDVVKTIIYFKVTRWYPSWHFLFSEAKQYLKFGLAMSFGNSFKYISEKSDRFFAGISWSVQSLGYYSFAFQLSAIPNQKINSIINQVSFSAFSKLQSVKEQFNSLYLQLTKMTFAMILPVYLGGFWLGQDLFTVVFGDKWDSAVLFFKALCLAQIIKGLAPINFQVHAAQGRARLYFILRAANGILLPITFFFTIRYGGAYGIVLPWFTTYVLFLVVLIWMALRWLDIGVVRYLKNLTHPLIAAAVMSLVLLGFQNYMTFGGTGFFSMLAVLILKISVCAAVYIGYFFFFDKQLISSLKKLRG